jgi:hypothetical protein
MSLGDYEAWRGFSGLMPRALFLAQQGFPCSSRSRGSGWRETSQHPEIKRVSALPWLHSLLRMEFIFKDFRVAVSLERWGMRGRFGLAFMRGR